jgi:mRNA interferase MazF
VGRHVKRGEIWWAGVDKPRPVCLLSRDEAYSVRALVIVAPLSTTIRSYAVEVKVGSREGLNRPSVINCDWLVTLPLLRLERRLGALSAEKLHQLDDALRFALGLDATG